MAGYRCLVCAWRAIGLGHLSTMNTVMTKNQTAEIHHDGDAQMNALSLASLRVTTGLMICLRGVIKIASPEAAVQVSDKCYLGLLSVDALQRPIGVAEVLLGALLVLGHFRRFLWLPAVFGNLALSAGTPRPISSGRRQSASSVFPFPRHGGGQRFARCVPG